MIITDGTYLLVSRKEGEKSGILFSQCLAHGETIRAMAVDKNSFDLGEHFGHEWEDKSTAFSIGLDEFRTETALLGLPRATLVVLVPNNTAHVFQGPLRSGVDMERTQWRSDRVGSAHSSAAVIFDDGSVNIHPAIDTGGIGVIALYTKYTYQIPQLPNTYDLFNASTGELIENGAVFNIKGVHLKSSNAPKTLPALTIKSNQ